MPFGCSTVDNWTLGPFCDDVLLLLPCLRKGQEGDVLELSGSAPESVSRFATVVITSAACC